MIDDGEEDFEETFHGQSPGAGPSKARYTPPAVLTRLKPIFTV
jgi:hypothetical protein